MAMLVTMTAGLSNATHIRTSLSVDDEIGVSGVPLLIPIKQVFHCPLSWTGFLLLAVPTLMRASRCGWIRRRKFGDELYPKSLCW